MSRYTKFLYVPPVFAHWKLSEGTQARQDEILLKIHHALTSVPNRPKVVEALEDTLLGAPPPSFEEYLRAIGSLPSKSAGGPIGLTYALMKHWTEDIHRLMYDLLVNMWEAKITSDWWQFRWLVPIPKRLTDPVCRL